MSAVKRDITPVQITGDIGDCVFTHHRIVHSAGSNTGAAIRLGVFSDFQKVRPPAPLVWRKNGVETLADGGMARCNLSGAPSRYHPSALAAAAAEKGDLLDEERFSLPWWDDNLEFAPTHPPHADMWREWNLGKSPLSSRRPGVDTRSWRPPVPTPVYHSKAALPVPGSQPQAPLPQWPTVAPWSSDRQKQSS
jgi:hypothetical protein